MKNDTTSRIRDAVARHRLTESGFGGWADEKIKNSPRSGSIIEPEEFHPQHLTISDQKSL